MSTTTKLTDRQLEIVCHLANGYSADEIGRELYLSASTVHQTLFSLRKKTGARTNAHLVSIVIAQGFLYWSPAGERIVEELANGSGG